MKGPKQLVWKDHAFSGHQEWWASATRSIGGDYHIRQSREDTRFFIHYRAKAHGTRHGMRHWFDDVDTLDQAKAVCQSHYDKQFAGLERV